jgi:hypothetical protein
LLNFVRSRKCRLLAQKDGLFFLIRSIIFILQKIINFGFEPILPAIAYGADILLLCKNQVLLANIKLSGKSLIAPAASRKHRTH